MELLSVLEKYDPAAYSCTLQARELVLVFGCVCHNPGWSYYQEGNTTTTTTPEQNLFLPTWKGEGISGRWVKNFKVLMLSSIDMVNTKFAEDKNRFFLDKLYKILD